MSVSRAPTSTPESQAASTGNRLTAASTRVPPERRQWRVGSWRNPTSCRFLSPHQSGGRKGWGRKGDRSFLRDKAGMCFRMNHQGIVGVEPVNKSKRRSDWRSALAIRIQ